MTVYILACSYYDADDGNMTTVEVFSSLEKARQKLKEQYEDRIECETYADYDCSVNYDYAEVTNVHDDYHWLWTIIEREVQ